MSDSKSWTLDNSSQASNPGDLRVSLIRWFRFYPTWPLIWFFSFVIFAVLGWYGHWSLWIVAALLLAINWFYWQRVREHFRCGCVNPAIVVSMDPMLIAAWTDLSKGFGSYPAIKIIKQALPTVCGQVPKVGCRLAVVALYENRYDDSPHWSDFDPRPIDCATTDLVAIQRIMDTLDKENWQVLNDHLEHLPQPLNCGLFAIQAED